MAALQKNLTNFHSSHIKTREKAKRYRIFQIFFIFFALLTVLSYSYANSKTMIGGYKIITLCGSTRFKEFFLAEQKRLTLEGNIVISVGLFGHSGDDEVWSESIKEMLDDMHKRKIDLADEIFVVNPGGYIGTSTLSEIDYARRTQKPVNYLESI
jgi:hypothetical protein